MDPITVVSGVALALGVISVTFPWKAWSHARAAGLPASPLGYYAVRLRGRDPSALARAVELAKSTGVPLAPEELAPWFYRGLDVERLASAAVEAKLAKTGVGVGKLGEMLAKGVDPLEYVKVSTQETRVG